MANKPRIGSDPFQKKDPLGWIGGDSPQETGKQAGVQSQPGNPEKPSKPGTRGVPNPPGNTSTPSKHDLSSPPSGPDEPGGPSGPPRGATTSKGLRPGWTRATFIVREQTLKKLKAVAYWERKELKRVMDEAMTAYLNTKDLPPIPDDPSIT